jgi:hypothetical protein
VVIPVENVKMEDLKKAAEQFDMWRTFMTAQSKHCPNRANLHTTLYTIFEKLIETSGGYDTAMDDMMYYDASGEQILIHTNCGIISLIWDSKSYYDEKIKNASYLIVVFSDRFIFEEEKVLKTIASRTEQLKELMESLTNQLCK